MTSKELTLDHISKRLTPDIITKIFKLKTKSNDDVKSIQLSTIGSGEGLISAVYRIQVVGFSHKASFVAKGLIRDVLLRKSLGVCNEMFEREIFFYKEILPQFKELQKSSGSKEDIQRNIPICYASHTGDDEDFIIFEDLSETLCEPVAKPTKNHRDMTLQVLAHFHALSMALRTCKPDLFSKLAANIKEEIYFNKNNREWYAKYLQNAIEIDKQVMKEYENESSIYYKKFIDVVSSDIFGGLNDLVTNPGDHPIMNHGDAWLPNFMYSNERTVVFDFQLLRYASPLTDLTFYLALCSNLCSTKEDFYEALNVYYCSLEHYLSDIGLEVNKVFSRKDFDKELKKYGKFGLFAALTTIPLLASDRIDVGQSLKEKYEGVEKIPLEDLWKLVPITDPEHKKKLVNVVRIAVDIECI